MSRPSRSRGRAALSKYGAVARIQIGNALAYPGEVVSRSLSIVLFMVVFTQLWTATYAAAGSADIAGLTLRETLWYLVLAESIILSQPRVSQQIAEGVRDGAVATVLNKPYNFLVYHLSVSLGDGIPRFGVNVVLGGAVVWLLIGPPPLSAGAPLVALAVLAGWMINFCIGAMIGLAAFVTEEVSAFDWIYSKFILLLGGVLIPLDFFPEWLRSIAVQLPFAYTVYAPAKLFVDLTLADLATVLAGQLVWLGVLAGALVVMYRRSVAWLVINGG